MQSTTTTGATASSSNALKTNRLKVYRARGKVARAIGEAVLTRDLVLNAFALKFDEAAYYFYSASMAFRAAGRWRDGGECLSRCGHIYSRLKLSVEAAIFFTEAADSFLKVDKIECVKHLDLAIGIYCDTGRFDAAGRLEREIAFIHFNLQDWEESAIHFEKAADFFIGDLLFDQCHTCLEKAVQCYLELGEYKTASDTCIKIAEGCITNNLRTFNCVDYLCRSLICLMAIPHEHGDHKSANKYKEIEILSQSFQGRYILWNNSKQSQFIANIIKAKKGDNVHDFADHLYYWDNVFPLDRFNIIMLKFVHEEILKEIGNHEKHKQKQQRAVLRKLEKKLKEDKRRLALIQRGKDPDKVAAELKEKEEQDRVDGAEVLSASSSEEEEEDEDEDGESQLQQPNGAQSGKVTFAPEASKKS
eukprot:gene5873-11864_t